MLASNALNKLSIDLSANPSRPDTDNDTYLDGDEVAAGSDPLDPLAVPEDADIALGAVLAGEKPGRTSDDDITIVDLTGIAAEDMAVAGLVWSRQG